MKYKSYSEDSDDIYADYKEFNITRTKNQNKTYIEVFQSSKEETKFDYIIVSIIFVNIKYIDISGDSDYSYTLKYHSYSYNQTFSKYVNTKKNNTRNNTNNNYSLPIDTNNNDPNNKDINNSYTNNNTDFNEITNSKI